MEFDFWETWYKIFGPADPAYPHAWIAIMIVLGALAVIGFIALSVSDFSLGSSIERLWKKCGSPSLQRTYLNIAKPLNIVFYYSIGYICASLFFFEWGADEINANSIRGIALFIFIAVCVSYIKFLGEAIILESRINELEIDIKIRKAKEALVKDYNDNLLNSIARLNTLTILERIAHDSASHRWEIKTTLQDYIRTNSPLKHEKNETKSEDKDIIRANEIVKWCYDNEPR